MGTLKEMGFDGPTIMAGLLAAYGAGLSTLMAFLGWLEKRKGVKVSYSMIFSHHGPISLGFTARNHGQTRVILRGACFKLPDGKILHIIESDNPEPLPYALDPGDSYDAWKTCSSLAHALSRENHTGIVMLQGCFKDALGKMHRTKKFEFDISSWLDSE